MRLRRKIAIGTAALTLGGASIMALGLVRHKAIRAWDKLRMLRDMQSDMVQTATEVTKRHDFLDELLDLGWPVNSDATISGNGSVMTVNLVGGGPETPTCITLQGDARNFKVVEVMLPSDVFGIGDLPERALLPNQTYAAFRATLTQYE